MSALTPERLDLIREALDSDKHPLITMDADDVRGLLAAATRLNQVMAGRDDTPRAANAWATPGQTWAALLDAGEDERLEMLAGALRAQEAAHECIIRFHADAAAAERDALATKLDAAIDVAHLDRQQAWSAETFGPAEVRGHRGVLDHIRKELVEIEAEPGDVTEWADLIILAFDGAWRSGHAPADTIAAIKVKQARNEAWTWPDWRTADPNKAIEHVRALDATQTGGES